MTANIDQAATDQAATERAATDQARTTSPSAQAAPERRISPPTGVREPRKVNIYERVTDGSCQLMPLFPYLDAGAIVPAGAIFRGRRDGNFGHFFHYNTIAEVVLVFGSNNAMLASGQIYATQPLHGVNSFLKDPTDPDAFLVLTITQHQSEDADQDEAIIFRCQNCREQLLRLDYNATPMGVPGYDPAQWGGTHDDEVPMFSTIWGSAEAAAQFNDVSVRTCSKCGHVNAEHPELRWGWQRWVDQARTAERAKAAMRTTAATAAAAAAAAADQGKQA